MGLFCCAPAMARGGTQAEEASVEVSSEMFEPAPRPLAWVPVGVCQLTDVWWGMGVSPCVGVCVRRAAAARPLRRPNTPVLYSS